jgi:curli biogenesis system outer membrane secretion channel CsgG
MKMHSSILSVAIASGLLGSGNLFAQKATLGVVAIKPTPSITRTAAKANKADSLQRIVESLNSQYADAINSTRKFDIVARADLDEVIKEQSRGESGNVDPATAAKAGKVSGAKYILVTTVDDFQDLTENVQFQATGRRMTRRTVRVGCNGAIYDSTTSKLLESVSVRKEVDDTVQEVDGVVKDGHANDKLLGDISLELAKSLANRVADVVFPIKVIDKTDKQLTINRGEGTGLAVGDLFNVFAVGKELKDPDTGEVLGRQEVKMGKARVTQVNPKTSLAELTEDLGVTDGAVLRRVPSPKP